MGKQLVGIALAITLGIGCAWLATHYLQPSAESTPATAAVRNYRPVAISPYNLRKARLI